MREADETGGGSCRQTGPSTAGQPPAKERIQLVPNRDPMKAAHPNKPHLVCVCVHMLLNGVYGLFLQKDPNTAENLP